MTSIQALVSGSSRKRRPTALPGGAEVLPRHGLADDRDARRVPAIPFVERPAVQDGNAQHVEVARSRPDRAGDPGAPTCRFDILDDKRHARRLHRQPSGQHGGLHARNRRDPASKLLVHVSGVRRGVTRVARIRFEHRDAVDRKADALCPGGAQHLEEDAGSAKQHDRHGHLEHDERVLEREPAVVRRSRLAVAAQRGHQVDPGGLERRREAECHAGDEREPDREGQDPVVEAQVHDDRQIERAERPDAPPGQDAAGEASGRGQQQALGQQVTNELSARRAQGQPDGHFLRARGPAHEQQRRQVAARDRQHEPDDAEQHRREPPQHGVQLRVDAHVARREHRNALSRILLRVLGCQPGAQDAHRGLRLRDGDAIPEAGLHEEAPPRPDAAPACAAARRAPGADEIGSQKSVTMPMLIVPL